jgi:hypothetical protein
LWLINKQSTQNDAQASNSIHQQCHHFNQDQSSSENSDKGAFPFQEFNSKELINIQNALRAKNNLINAMNPLNTELLLKTKNNVSSEAETPLNVELLLKTKNNASSEVETIFLNNETLREPLLHIANKLLG